MISITAVGRLAADVELRKSSKGTLFGSFDLAVSKGFGEKQHTVYLNCMCFGSAAERMSNANVKKGSLIMITGDLDVVEFTRRDGGKGRANKVLLFDWQYVSTGRREKNEVKKEQNEVNEPQFYDTYNCADDEPLPF